MARKQLFDSLTESQATYIACLIDNCSCVYIGKQKSPSIKKGYIWKGYIKLSSCDNKVIEYINNILYKQTKCISSIEARTKHRKEGSVHTKINSILLDGPLLDKLIPYIEPYLVIRTEQINILKEFRKTLHKKSGKELASGVEEYREELLILLRNKENPPTYDETTTKRHR